MNFKDLELTFNKIMEIVTELKRDLKIDNEELSQEKIKSLLNDIEIFDQLITKSEQLLQEYMTNLIETYKATKSDQNEIQGQSSEKIIFAEKTELGYKIINGEINEHGKRN